MSAPAAARGEASARGDAARPWRGAVVGCGRMGAAHAERIAVLGGGELIAVWDADRTRAAEQARRLGTAEAAGLDDILAPGRVDWALVATPPDGHRELALRLLEAGVHVLCEKPLAPTSGAAREMLEAARAARRVAWTSTKYPWVPDVRRARQLVLAGALGRLQRVEVAFAGSLDPRSDWRGDARVSGGGVLMDNGPHAFDLVEALAGQVAGVAAREGERAWGSGVDEDVRVELRGAAGWEGAIEVSWTRASGPAVYATLAGTAGTLHLGWKESWWVDEEGARHAIGPGYEKLAALDGQLLAFYRALEGDPAPAPDRGPRDLQLVEACYASLRAGAPVAVG